jgi:hypothetical protein
MGKQKLIIKSLEKFVELVKPFLPKSMGGGGKHLCNGIPSLINMEKNTILHNPLTRWVGDNPLIFFDCGAIIDFEKYFHDNCCGSRKAICQRDSYEYLKILSKTNRTIIPDYMFFELKRHRNCYIGRRKEISDRTFEVIESINKNSNKIMSNLEPSLDKEKIRLDIYWATKECFKNNSKKDLYDRISDNDKNLIVDAIYAKNSKINGKDVTASIIFSPDYHILQLVYFLKTQEYDYQGIFAFSSRSEKNGRYEIH